MHLKANIDLFSVNSGRQNKPTSVYDKSAFFLVGLIVGLIILFALLVPWKRFPHMYKLWSNKKFLTTAHPWYGGHSISISACGVWGARDGVQVSRRELHTHIHLNQVRVEFLSYIKLKKKCFLEIYMDNFIMEHVSNHLMKSLTHVPLYYFED